MCDTSTLNGLVDLQVGSPFLLGDNGRVVQVGLPSVSYKSAIIGVLIFGQAKKKDALPIQPTINLPIMSAHCVWHVWPIITYVT